MDPRHGLLKASRTVFVRHGFRRTSMSMVAAEAGVTRQAIYHHFSSKEELFSALVDDLQVLALEQAQRAASQSASDGLARRLFRVMYAYHQSLVASVAGSAFATELMEESSRHCAEVVAGHAKRFDAILVTVVDEAVNKRAFVLRERLKAQELVALVSMAAKGVKFAHAGSGERRHALALEQMIDIICAGAGCSLARLQQAEKPELKIVQKRGSK